MKKIIIILSAFFGVVCILLTVISPDYLSMLIVGVMGVAVALGIFFGMIPAIRYSQGFKQGRDSIEEAREVNAENIWTAVESVTPFFGEKKLDEMFGNYLENVRDQRDKGVVISDIEDSINDETLAIHSWRGVVLQIAGILTALGLLGTFLGLVTGIGTVSFSTTEATMESIENLLRGITTAFYTSIAGVIISILFNIAYRVIWNILMREMGLFTEMFHSRIQPSAEEQIRAKQYLNTEKMIESLNDIRNNSNMSVKTQERDPAYEQRMMMDILSGMKRGEFTFSLEPFCDLGNKNVTKARTLLRWTHEVLGVVQPSVYMPTVEADGFIAKLSQTMWDQVCETVKRWVDEGKHPVPVVFSISKTLLLALDVDDCIEQLLDRYQLEPRYIEIAIDASCYVICNQEARSLEQKLLKRGCRVSVEHFNGNLIELGDTSADEICLDLSLFEKYDGIETIFTQAINAHINLTCEAISSAKLLADVKKYGCLSGQGAHLYPEMTCSEFERLMRYSS